MSMRCGLRHVRRHAPRVLGLVGRATGVRDLRPGWLAKGDAEVRLSLLGASRTNSSVRVGINIWFAQIPFECFRFCTVSEKCIESLTSMLEKMGYGSLGGDGPPSTAAGYVPGRTHAPQALKPSQRNARRA